MNWLCNSAIDSAPSGSGDSGGDPKSLQELPPRKCGSAGLFVYAAELNPYKTNRPLNPVPPAPAPTGERSNRIPIPGHLGWHPPTLSSAVDTRNLDSWSWPFISAPPGPRDSAGHTWIRFPVAPTGL